jgi:hypothetical protein
MYNGFGFAQPDSAMANGTGKCFQTFDEVVTAVDNWFDKKLQTMTLSEALCHYNRGSGELFYECLRGGDKAPYLRHFISLATK